LRPDDTIITDLLGKANKPTAAVCWIAGTAYDLIANCKANEIRIPADLTIVAFDGHSTPQDAIWSLSAVRAPWAQVARTAVLLLDSVLKGESVPEQTILPLEFIPGSTS
jgi:DNA-binding LacI/PurR family transcriptional regulator